MVKIREVWYKLFSMPASSAQVMRRDQWTRDIARLMFIVVSIATVVILLGIFSGTFSFSETIPLYFILVAAAIAYIGSRNKGWRWARFLLVITSLFTSFYFSYETGYQETGLAYVVAILLTGMLFNARPTWLVTFVSILGYTLLGADFNFELIISEAPTIIKISFLMVGTTIILAYFENSLSRMVVDLVQGNEKLEREIYLRQQAEAAREEQESLYIRLAENTSDLVSEIAMNGTIASISPSYLPTLGYTPGFLVGTRVKNLVHPDDHQKTRDVVKQATRNRRPVRERLRIQHFEGHYLHMEVSVSPLYNEIEELYGFVLSSRDITQQVIAEDTLKDSENQFRSIIDATPLGIHMYTMDENDALFFSGYNPAADSILGIDHAPLVGKHILEAFPALSATELPDTFRSVAQNGSHYNQNPFTYTDKNINGIFEMQAFQYAPGKMVTMFENITSKIEAEEALRNSQEIFSKAFHTSPDAININRLSDGMYININQGFSDMTGYTHDEVIGVSSLELNIWADEADRARLVKGLQKNGEVKNLEAKFRFKDGTVKTGLMSARVIEVDHEQCILSITRDISERKRTEIELLQTHTQLEEAYDATLEGWVRALEMREHDTADHSRRVVELTIAMAKRFGITGEALLHTQRGALLHDIGKIGVPDSILLKPESLSMDEWVIMRQHPGFARNLLQEIAYLVPAMDIPYCHHERWDGTGYPRGISGEEIPLAARIFSVIDVYDALLSNRPYRPAWSWKEVRQYLINHKGRQFDPQVVDDFLAFIEGR